MKVFARTYFQSINFLQNPPFLFTFNKRYCCCLFFSQKFPTASFICKIVFLWKLCFSRRKVKQKVFLSKNDYFSQTLTDSSLDIRLDMSNQQVIQFLSQDPDLNKQVTNYSTPNKDPDPNLNQRVTFFLHPTSDADPGKLIAHVLNYRVLRMDSTFLQDKEKQIYHHLFEQKLLLGLQQHAQILFFY